MTAVVLISEKAEGRVPLPSGDLPSGEGGAERRVRVGDCINLGPHPA